MICSFTRSAITLSANLKPHACQPPDAQHAIDQRGFLHNRLVSLFFRVPVGIA